MSVFVFELNISPSIDEVGDIGLGGEAEHYGCLFHFAHYLFMRDEFCSAFLDFTSTLQSYRDGLFLGIKTREVVQQLVGSQFLGCNINQMLNPLADGIHAGKCRIATTECRLINLNIYCTHFQTSFIFFG